MTNDNSQGVDAKSELAQQAENAARYLWLRDNAKAADWDAIAAQALFLEGSDLDEVIDHRRAAIAAPGGALDEARKTSSAWGDLRVRWQLYSSFEGAGAAEAKLTAELRSQLGRAMLEDDLTMGRAQQIRDHMYSFMEQFVHLGARDTEPEVALVEAIEKIIPAARGLTR